jgi:hypothetical protein
MERREIVHPIDQVGTWLRWMNIRTKEEDDNELQVGLGLIGSVGPICFFPPFFLKVLLQYFSCSILLRGKQERGLEEI